MSFTLEGPGRAAVGSRSSVSENEDSFIDESESIDKVCDFLISVTSISLSLESLSCSSCFWKLDDDLLLKISGNMEISSLVSISEDSNTLDEFPDGFRILATKTRRWHDGHLVLTSHSTQQSMHDAYCWPGQ